MTNSRALFLDIDGTILAADHTIQRSTIKAIKQVKEQGIEVFIATGRPLHEIGEIKNKLAVDSAIGYNGGYAIHQNKEIFHQIIDPLLVDHFIQTSAQHNHELVLYRKDANLFTDMESPRTKKFIDYFDLKFNHLYQPTDRDKILGITLIYLPKSDLKYYQSDAIFLSQANIPGLKSSYDVIQKGVNKGVAVEHILTQLKISPKDAIAFGDGLNDREMLSIVGNSFAMGNADPDLFQYAKFKTKSVNDHGIYNGLKQLNLVR